MRPTADQELYPKRLLNVLRLLAIGLAALNVAAAMLRQSMNADGISYLDMGDAYFRGDWDVAINGTWSPLYAWLLGATLKLFEPSISWEFPTVHLVNFAVFLLALVCFEYFWRQATSLYYARDPLDNGELPACMPTWAWLCLGYGLFIWSSISLTELFAVTPDMLVAASVYAASGLVLRIAGGDARRRTLVLLGVVLGLGYLAKAAMFPLGLVFLVVAALVQGNLSRGARRTVPAVLAFLVVAGPFIGVLSAKEGHFTFSEVGKLTYLKHVRNVPYPHWQPGVVDIPGAPEHPVRRIGEEPTVYEFRGPVGGTYPLSYNPYYWYEGLDPGFDLGLQLRALASNLRYYFDLFLRTQGAFFGIVLVLTLVALRHGQSWRAWKGWGLVLVALAAFGMYGLVYVDNRYISAFVVLFWTGFLMYARLEPVPAHRSWLTISGAALVLSVAANIGAYHLDGLNALLGIAPSPAGAVSGTPGPSVGPPEVAEGLRDLGLRPGDEVGVIGYSFDSFWARLARLRIVAEVTPEDADAFLWQADPGKQEAVLQRFAELGVRAVVAEYFPRNTTLPGWRMIGETGYYAYLFPLTPPSIGSGLHR